MTDYYVCGFVALWQRCAIPRYSTRTSRYSIGISWNSNTFGIPSDFPNSKMLKILLRTSMLRGTLYSQVPYGRTTRFYDVSQVRYCTVRCHRTSIFRGVPLEFQMKYLVLEFQGIPLEYLQGLGISKTGGTGGTSIRTSNVQITYREIGTGNQGCIGGYV